MTLRLRSCQMYVDDVGTAEFEENCKCDCGIGWQLCGIFLCSWECWHLLMGNPFRSRRGKIKTPVDLFEVGDAVGWETKAANLLFASDCDQRPRWHLATDQHLWVNNVFANVKIICTDHANMM